LIAAQTSDRGCIGIDEDPYSVDIAIRRWQLLTGRPAIHAVTDERFDDLINSSLARAETRAGDQRAQPASKAIWPLSCRSRRF
jgi:hypothetical protein